MEYPNCYLHVLENKTGREWIVPINQRQSLNLKTRIKGWVKTEFCGELALDGNLMPELDGDYYGRIITDGRPPTTCIVWSGAGFYLKTTY